MNSKAATFLRVLGNRFHNGPIDLLFKKLPKEEVQAAQEAVTTSQDVEIAFNNPTERMDAIHYSWFAPLIATETPERQGLLLAALPVKHAQGVLKLLRKNPQVIELSPLLKSYLQQQLLTKLAETRLLPLGYLPKTDLKNLASLTKSQLVEIVDYLGIYDLAEEIRRLVNKNHLRTIYSVLPEAKHRFLRQCLQQKEKIATPRLHLESWHGDKQELLKLLHPRGLARFGKGLNGQHPDVIWHIVHRLDTGRGKRVGEYANLEEKSGVVFVLTTQIINVVNYLQKSET